VDHSVGEGDLTVEVRTTAVRAEEAVEAAEMVTIESASLTRNTNPKHQPSKIASSTSAGQNMQRRYQQGHHGSRILTTWDKCHRI
jgi:hypothetical protein